MTRILCLWLPNWPIQRLARTRPELSGRPLVLAVAGRARQPRGGVLPRGGGQGVRVDMPLAEAKSLVRELGDRAVRTGGRSAGAAAAGGGVRAVQPVRGARRRRRAGELAAGYFESHAPVGDRGGTGGEGGAIFRRGGLSRADRRWRRRWGWRGRWRIWGDDCELRMRM